MQRAKETEKRVELQQEQIKTNNETQWVLDPAQLPSTTSKQRDKRSDRRISVISTSSYVSFVSEMDKTPSGRQSYPLAEPESEPTPATVADPDLDRFRKINRLSLIEKRAREEEQATISGPDEPRKPSDEMRRKKRRKKKAQQTSE